MDPNLPLFRVLIRLAHGIGLPVDAVKKIRNEFLSWWWQVTHINKSLTHNPNVPSFLITLKGWSGTHRMVNFNRMYSKGVWRKVLGTRRPSWIELLQSLTGP